MIVLKIEGMISIHCVKRLEKSLRNVDGVTHADINLEDKQAIIKGDNISENDLIKTVSDNGYEITEII